VRKTVGVSHRPSDGVRDGAGSGPVPDDVWLAGCGGYPRNAAWPVFARIFVVPASRDGLGPFYQDVISVDPLEPWGSASAAYRLQVLAHTIRFPVSGAQFVPSNNNDVWRLEVGYLRVAWRGDRSRLAREAELLERLRGFLPVPEVLDCGGDDRLSWSLTAAMPGTAYEHLCVQPSPPGLRDLAREVAALLRALHSWPVPGELAEMLRHDDVGAQGELLGVHVVTWPDRLSQKPPRRSC
jgi:Phosphotransferase enzyme family